MKILKLWEILSSCTLNLQIPVTKASKRDLRDLCGYVVCSRSLHLADSRLVPETYLNHLTHSVGSMRTSTGIWLSNDQKEEVKQLIENHNDDSALIYTENIDEAYVENGALTFSIGSYRNPLTVHGEIIFSGSDKDRATVKQLVETVGLHQEKLADDRGRVSLGSQYAGKIVQVAIVGSEETGDEDGD